MGQFPAGLPASLAIELDQLGEEVLLAISREVPAYARPLEGRFGRGVRRGVAEALRRFLTVVEAGPQLEPNLAASREVYVRLGRGEVRAGRSLDNLLGAYRVGARVSWRRLGEAAARNGVDAAGLVSLAEMMFAYIDGISAASAEGYAAEQFTAAGERERMLDRLGEMLLTGAPVDAVAQVAQSGRLALPRRLAAVLIPACVPAGQPSVHDGDDVRDDPAYPADPGTFGDLGTVGDPELTGILGTSGDPAVRALRLPDDCPRTVQGADTWLFVGATEPGPGRAALVTRLTGLAAIVGPAVPWAQTATSLSLIHI